MDRDATIDFLDEAGAAAALHIRREDLLRFVRTGELRAKEVRVTEPREGGRPAWRKAYLFRREWLVAFVEGPPSVGRKRGDIGKFVP